MSSEKFSNLSFDLVSFDRRTPCFQGNSYSEMRARTLNPEQGAFRGSKYLILLEKAPVLPRIMEPMISAQSSRNDCRQRNLLA